jgi:hypothetical protein
MAQAKYPSKPIFTRIPANWKPMTDAEKKAASEAMAKALQRQLWIKPKGWLTGLPGPGQSHLSALVPKASQLNQPPVRSGLDRTARRWVTVPPNWADDEPDDLILPDGEWDLLAEAIKRERADRAEAAAQRLLTGGT